MFLFKTTAKQLIKLETIVKEMERVGLNYFFVKRLYQLAKECQGTFELMDMWFEHYNEPKERELDIKALEAAIKDYEWYETSI